MMEERNLDFPDAITGALSDAAAEEFGLNETNEEFTAFLSALAYFRDNVNVTYLHMATLQSVWEYLRERKHLADMDQLVGRLTYRFFTALEAEYSGNGLQGLADVYSLSSGNAFVLRGIDDVNAERLKGKDEIKEMLVGNPWFLFLMVAENNLSLLFKLHKETTGG